MSTTLISLIGGGLFGFVKFIFQAHMENKHQQQLALIQNSKALTKDKQRAASIKDTGISFTRRVLAIILCATLVSPVWYAYLNPDSYVSLPQVSLDKTFWDYVLPWRDGKEIVKYVQVKAPVMAMPIVDMCAAIIGFYFGSGGSRSR